MEMHCHCRDDIGYKCPLHKGFSKEWCITMAEVEGSAAIGAGMMDHPLRSIETTNNPTQVEPVEGLAEDGVLDAKAAALVVATEHGVPTHVLECLTTGGSLIPPNAIDSMVRAVLSSRITQQAEEVARLREALKGTKDALDSIPAPHSFPLWQRMCAAIRKAEAALNEQPDGEETE